MSPRSDIDALERAALASGPPGAVVLASSISATGVDGAVATVMPGPDHVYAERFSRTGPGWGDPMGVGGGPGLAWLATGDDGEHGAVILIDEAPPDATAARISHQGDEHVVPVRHGWFAWIGWGPADGEPPVVLEFDR